MDLGLVTHPCIETDLEAIADRAASLGLDALEIDVPPVDQTSAAGETRLDVSKVEDEPSHLSEIQSLINSFGLEISMLTYQDVNHLHPDPDVRAQRHAHLEAVIKAAGQMDIATVGTFIGRDPSAGLDEALEEAKMVWPDLLEIAESHDVRIAIENAPMDHIHPHGINVFHNPYAWDDLFAALDSPALGLNYDPSHLYWLDIDHLDPVNRFSDRIFNVHAKDTEIRRDRLNELGVLTNRGMTDEHWWRYRLPGLGEIDWSAFLRVLYDIGYDGPISIEHEDATFAFYGPFADPPTDAEASEAAIADFWKGIRIARDTLTPLV